ncbi:MAG TPA: hypothetical protein K8V79_10095 [Acinetobacter lwoffii]|uniref:Uncharacterized protein n=1 Tax=Acinetobacter lwoffii TaxID=28090 RepID=A0A9D2UU05_ACILW|nr:hypothetical protein [Acinetobacter lwoffii]
MDLFYILLNYHTFPAHQLIYAEQPWTLQSRAILVEASSSPVLNLDQIEYRFFLELSWVHRLFQLYSSQNLCLASSYQRMIEFALRQQSD